MGRTSTALTFSVLLVLASFNLGATAPPPPPPSVPPPHSAPGSAPPQPAATSAATTVPPPRAAPPQGPPPASAAASTPPVGSRPTSAPATAQVLITNPPPTTARPSVAPTTAPTTARPASAPLNAQVLNVIPSPATARVPAGLTQGPVAQVPLGAPAPGTLNNSVINTTISITSPGSLSQAQLTDLCSVVVQSLGPQFPTVRSCMPTSQTASQPFTTGSRRLQQSSSGTVTLLVGLQLSFAAQSQIAGIQTALNNIRITIASQVTVITVINIVVIQTTVITTTTTVTPPTNVVAAPSGSITIATGTSANTTITVTTAVPPTATGNTTINVTPAQAKPPAAPTGGTSTTTTVSNTTTTTTITTIAIFVTTNQVTVITQYFYTINIGASTGVLITTNFNLNGNVANSLPTVITGGATTGQTTTVRVTGATTTIVRSTQITTAVQTATTSSTTTTTTTNTGTSTTSTTGTTTNTNTVGGSNTTTPTVITGVTRQVCNVPLNPYGVYQITANEGTLVKGGFLVSVWNDLNNNPGQGNLIYQCLPNGTTTIWANVTVSGACAQDRAGVGLTMALSRCGPVVIVGSTPIIPQAGSAGKIFPGCLIALDTSGKVVNEVKSPGINAPWGSVCTFQNNQITLALSSVGGGFSSNSTNSTTASSAGRRLLQTSSATSSNVTGGTVLRWTFSPPTLGTKWDLGTPKILASGISTNGSAAAVSGGNCGPGGLTMDDSGNVYIPDNLGNRTLVVPNGMTTTTENSAVALQVTNPGLNGPNSLTFGGGRLVGTNTQDGSLFFINLNSARNGGTGSKLQVDPLNAPGVLFQAIFTTDSTLGTPLGQVWYVHDGSSTLNVVINSGSPTSAPSSGPSRAPAPGVSG